MGCPSPHPPLPARSLVSTCTCGSIPEAEPAPRGLLADELRRKPEWDPQLQRLPQPTRGAPAGRTPRRPGRLPLDRGGGVGGWIWEWGKSSYAIVGFPALQICLGFKVSWGGPRICLVVSGNCSKEGQEGEVIGPCKSLHWGTG